jgi:charged multivesicular body protein 7
MVDRIFSKDMFTKEFSGVLGSKQVLSDTDFTVLLTFLARDKREIAFDNKVRILQLCIWDYSLKLSDR